MGVLEIKRHIGLQTNTQGAKQMLLQPNEFVVQFLSPLCRCVKTIPHSPSVCHLVCACVCVCVCVYVCAWQYFGGLLLNVLSIECLFSTS